MKFKVRAARAFQASAAFNFGPGTLSLVFNSAEDDDDVGEEVARAEMTSREARELATYLRTFADMADARGKIETARDQASRDEHDRDVAAQRRREGAT